MIMNEMKTNTGKLLAAVLVMAMIIAGAAVMFSDSEVSATAQTADLDDLPAAVEGTTTIGAAGDYLIDKNVTIDADGAEVNLYIAQGASNIVITYTKGTVSLFAATSSASNDTVSYDDGLKLVITGSVTVSNNSGALAISAGTDKINASSTSGIAITNKDTSVIYYANGANQSINLANCAEVRITNGTATVYQGDNSVTLTNIVNTTGVTLVPGAVGAYPTINGTAAGTADAKATVTFTGGLFKLDGTFTTTDSNLIVNSVEMTANSVTYYSNQIVNKIGADAVTAVTINGTIAQRTSVDLGAKTNTLGIGDGDMLIINNNVTVTATGYTAANAGTAVVYGALITTSETEKTPVELEAGTVYVGPNGYTDATGAGFIKNTNVDKYADNYFINGVPSSSDVGDAIIGADGLTIPEGMTFTLKGNLGLDGKTLTVNGTLIIENRATIFDCGDGKIVLGAKGSIQNNGTIGKMMSVDILGIDATTPKGSITLQGVSGVSFGIVKDADDNNILGVSGSIGAVSGTTVNEITIKGAYISGDFTTAKKVTTIIDGDVKTSKNITVTLNGNVKAANSGAFQVSEGATITINGKVTTDADAANSDAIVETYVGILDLATGDLVSNGQLVSITMGNNVAGVTMTVKRVAVADENDATKTNYYLRAYISGNIDEVDSTDSSGTTGVTVSTTNGTRYYNLYVAAETTLNVTEDASLSITTGTVVIEGTIVGEGGSNLTISGGYIGANYSVVTGEGTADRTETEYYTTLAAAMEAIDTADNKEVTAVVDTLDISVTVADGQVLNLTVNKEISQDAVLTIENGGTQTGNIADVQGKMVVYVDASANQPASYAVVTVDDAETTTYSGFAIAISEAGPGDVITVENAEVTGSLTIPSGVTININGTLKVGKDLTVSNEAVLNGGSIIVDGTKITVNGTMDVTDGNLSTNATLTSPGTTLVGATLPAKFNGAYYLNADSENVITSVANAVKYANENTTTVVNVRGTVSETGELALNGITVNIESGADVRLGNVSMTGNATLAATGDLTATVSGLNGEGDAASNGAIALSKSAVTLKTTTVTNAAGVAVNTFTVSGIDGTMTVSAGQVAFTGTDATAESKLTVASGATMLLNVASTTGSYTIDGDNVEFVVDGTLAVVNGASVTFADAAKDKVAVIAGTMDISDDASVTVYDLIVTGTVNVSAVENDEGALEVAGALVLGSEPSTVGAPGAVVGEVELGNSAVIIAYAGADVSGMTVTDSTGNALTENYTTQFYINGAVYMTAYGNGADVEDALAVPEFKLEGYDKPAQTTPITSAATWKLEDDATASNVAVGSVDALYLEVTAKKITITVSMGSQISLFIDGVKPASNSAQLTVGTHDVVATVNPGYTGDVTITFNGQTVTDGKIVVTADMDGKDVVLSVTGNISVDTGSTSGSSDGMGLTEILLVILVILIVVMAIMVALRLMRS